MKPNVLKIVESLNYLASKCPNRTIDKMTAYKMLWLADRYHIRQYGRSIANDKICALPKGLVPSTAMSIVDGKVSQGERKAVRKNSRVSYSSIAECNLSVFSKTDIQVLDLIFDTFAKYKPLELSDISHSFPEWKRYEQHLQDIQKKNSYVIDHSDLFAEVSDSRCNGLFINNEELLTITREMYEETLNIR